MKGEQMNEIKETLLMIFLEKKEKLDLYEKLFNGGDLTVYECDCLNREVDLWNESKQEELGRTIPEEFEFYVSDDDLFRIKNRLRRGFACHYKKALYFKNKIKITVVEE